MSETKRSQTDETLQEPLPVKQVWQILIVDDEESIRELFMSIFRAPDYNTTAAANGPAALAMGKEQKFDLAFIDYSMPEMNGVEASRRLRQAQPQMKSVIISGFPSGCYTLPAQAQLDSVMFSGYPMPDRADMVEHAGASAFLAKPFSVETVRSLAERLLGIR